MSRASMAGHIRGISAICGFMRPVREQAAVSVFHLVSPVKRDGISAYALRIGERPVYRPASVSSGLGWPRAGVRWCGVFQVVKTAQSRGRTERTLLTALPQLLWRDKGREVWFSLDTFAAKVTMKEGPDLSSGQSVARRTRRGRRSGVDVRLRLRPRLRLDAEQFGPAALYVREGGQKGTGYPRACVANHNTTLIRFRLTVDRVSHFYWTLISHRSIGDYKWLYS